MQVNKCYEFIASKDTRAADGPNPENIVLILKAQSILFERFSDILQPFEASAFSFHCFFFFSFFARGK